MILLTAVVLAWVAAVGLIIVVDIKTH